MPRPDTLEPEEWNLWSTWMHAQRLLAREIDRRLQSEVGISKAEFSVLVTLLRSPGNELRVMDVAEALGWEKSRVSHQLTRMESRALLARVENGAAGRRTGIRMTAKGRRIGKAAVERHADDIRQLFFDLLSPDQAAAILAWSERMADSLGHRETV